MENFRVAKKSLYEKTDKKLQRISGTIGAIVAITGAISGLFGWIQSQFTAAISSQIDDFRQEVKSSDAAQNQAITRLELTNLIKNDPTNIVAIEKMGRYYFKELDGDQYMTAMFSNWAKEYGGDASIVIGEK